ncbi:hypothetical protein SD81_023855 [Tolypothrix campylonemoides VB511288]|nr:hypothetical protein SD81_023855 [Tolypothrix campylonemoides VB511288]
MLRVRACALQMTPNKQALTELSRARQCREQSGETSSSLGGKLYTRNWGANDGESSAAGGLRGSTARLSFAERPNPSPNSGLQTVSRSHGNCRKQGSPAVGD